MPSTIVHLFIAKEIANHLKIKSLSQFYLGAIAPDAVNPDDNAPAEVRFPAHVRQVNIDNWKNSILNYYLTNKNKYANDLDLFKGYTVHIISDIMWDELVEWKMFDEFKRLGIKDKDLKIEKYKELFKLNSYLLKQKDWIDIEYQLKKSHSIDINTVPKELIDEYLSPVISENYPKTINKSCQFLTTEHIDITTKAVLKFWRQMVAK
ncbi:MAG: hypothetical protein GX896_02475 [Clostridiales bacterium]|nr:hypothetical protein [Clostridiales bacterium]